MKWIKRGRLFETDNYAAVPIAERLYGDTYRIYYSSRDEQSRSRLEYVVIDINTPSSLVSSPKRPKLPLGMPGFFDDSGVMATWLVNNGTEKWLYYIGWNLGKTVPFRNALGLAISRDEGKSFQKISDGPILDRSIYDPSFVASACILKEERLWRMWYLSCIGWEAINSKLEHKYHIKYAESKNGIDWSRGGIVCIDFKDEKEYAISRPSVIFDSGKYRMWYSCRGSKYRIGYAESEDGIIWERMDDIVGIGVSPSGWDSDMIEYPFVFRNNTRLYMLYNGNSYGKTGIGLAVLDE